MWANLRGVAPAWNVVVRNCRHGSVTDSLPTTDGLRGHGSVVEYLSLLCQALTILHTPGSVLKADAILHREYLASRLASYWGFQAQLNVGTCKLKLRSWPLHSKHLVQQAIFPAAPIPLPTPTHRNEATLSILAVTVILKYTLALLHEVARLTEATFLADGGDFGADLLTVAIQVGTGRWTGGKAAGEAAVGWALQSCAVQKELV